MPKLTNDEQYMLNSMVEHETGAAAGALTFVAAYPQPNPNAPLLASLWSEDGDGVRRIGIVDDKAVFNVDVFETLVKAGFVLLNREYTAMRQGEGAMVRAYVLTDAGHAAADSAV